MERPSYFDRRGEPIDLMRWAELWEDDSYRFVERTWLVEGKIEVVTTWNGFDPYRVQYDDRPACIFNVAELIWTDRMLTGVQEHPMLASEVDAHAAHEALVKELRVRSALRVS